MNNTTITGTPSFVSPINDIYGNTFRFDNLDAGATNFKYVTKLWCNNQFLVQEAFPPRPNTAAGYYSPYKSLLSQVTYKIQPTITSLTYSTNSVASYYVNYGLEYSPNLVIADVLDVSGKFGFSFSSTTGVSIGDYIYIQSSNPDYNGPSTVTSILTTKSFVTNLSVPTASAISNKTGVVTDLVRFNGTSSIYWAYNGTRQYGENNIDFTSVYLMGGLPVKDFLTDYPLNDCRPIRENQFETMGLMLNGSQFTSGVVNWTYQTYGTWYSPGYVDLEFYDDPGGDLIIDDDQTINMVSGLGSWAFTVSDTGGVPFGSFIDYYNWIVSYIPVDLLGYYNVSYVAPNMVRFTAMTASVSSNFTTTTVGSYGYVQMNFTNQHNYLGEYMISSNNFSRVVSPTSSGVIRMDIPTGTRNLTLMGVTMSGVDRYTVQLPYKSTVRSFCLDRSCSVYVNTRLMFLNRQGAFDYWNFQLDNKRTNSISRTEYKQELGFTYNIGDRGRTVLAQKVTEEHNVNTNWITEEQYYYLSELVSSPEVYVIDENNGNAYPVIITDTSYEFKTYNRDKLFNLTVSYSMAYPVETQNM